MLSRDLECRRTRYQLAASHVDLTGTRVIGECMPMSDSELVSDIKTPSTRGSARTSPLGGPFDEHRCAGHHIV